MNKENENHPGDREKTLSELLVEGKTIIAEYRNIEMLLKKLKKRLGTKMEK